MSGLLLFTGSLSVLPTVFHLTLGLLREMSPRGADKMPTVVITTCINSLKHLLGLRRYDNDKHLPDWHRLVTSCLASVVRRSVPGENMWTHSSQCLGPLCGAFWVFSTSWPIDVFLCQKNLQSIKFITKSLTLMNLSILNNYLTPLLCKELLKNVKIITSLCLIFKKWETLILFTIK